MQRKLAVLVETGGKGWVTGNPAITANPLLIRFGVLALGAKMMKAI